MYRRIREKGVQGLQAYRDISTLPEEPVTAFPKDPNVIPRVPGERMNKSNYRKYRHRKGKKTEGGGQVPNLCQSIHDGGNIERYDSMCIRLHVGDSDKKKQSSKI